MQLSVKKILLFTAIVAAQFATLSFMAPQVASADAVGVRNYSPTAGYLNKATCDNLGRLWVAQGKATGCSREKCQIKGAKIVGDYNTETCRGPGGRYSVSLESRLCKGLNRQWIDSVNQCLKSVNRGSGQAAQANAPQCNPSYTTYVIIPAQLGDDLCVTAVQAAQYQIEATAAGTTVGVIAFHYSKLLCDNQAKYQWNGQTCNPLRTNEKKVLTQRPVFVIGDSVTWRPADEVTDLNPTWEIDGEPGTALPSLKARFQNYLSTHTMPSTFVVALGANNGITNTTKQDYVNVTKLVPASTKIVFVTPYRDAAIYGQRKATLLTNTDAWMKAIAKDRPHTCIAPWKEMVTKNPRLTIDGVHETPSAELVWAKIVTRSVKACS